MGRRIPFDSHDDDEQVDVDRLTCNRCDKNEIVYAPETIEAG